MSGWEYMSYAFQSKTTSSYPPAVAEHDGGLYVLWQDTTQRLPLLRWAFSDSIQSPFRFGPPVDFNRGSDTGSLAAPSLIDVDGTLHAIFAESGCDGQLIHYQLDDKSTTWKRRAGIGLSSAFDAPTLLTFNGRLMCIVRQVTAPQVFRLYWTIWDQQNGWSRARVINGADGFPVSAIERPALVLLVNEINLLFTPTRGGGLVQMRYDRTNNTWVATDAPRSQILTTGCDGAGYPTLLYGFLAYGIASKDAGLSSVSVLQYNLNTWQVRESLLQLTIATPVLAFFSGYVFCFFLDVDGYVVYSRRFIDTRGDDWMNRIPGVTPISAINIPGTHDSAATVQFMQTQDQWAVRNFVQTQKLTISQQLNIGIRFLDLRLTLIDGTLQMVHGTYELNVSFDQVVASLAAFLKSNPSETVLVTIKNEKDVSPELFHVAVNEVIQRTVTFWYVGKNLPTLVECRRQIVLFKRFAPQGAVDIGFDVSQGWLDNSSRFEILLNSQPPVPTVIQDNWKYPGTAFLENIVAPKWTAVSALLQEARLAPNNPNAFPGLYLNFLSANGLPVQSNLRIATGGYFEPEDSTAYADIRGMNQRLLDVFVDWAGRHEDPGRLGVLVLDFPQVPAVSLITAIINSNFF